mmetsp:Transcript_102376/g.315905  ORF Transcript_102376/g.315905 Transcript_102376/m.315905 type:complete len:295 (-) Transcript_102376:3-887(-)
MEPQFSHRIRRVYPAESNLANLPEMLLEFVEHGADGHAGHLEFQAVLGFGVVDHRERHTPELLAIQRPSLDGGLHVLHVYLRAPSGRERGLLLGLRSPLLGGRLPVCKLCPGHQRPPVLGLLDRKIDVTAELKALGPKLLGEPGFGAVPLRHHGAVYDVEGRLLLRPPQHLARVHFGGHSVLHLPLLVLLHLLRPSDEGLGRVHREGDGVSQLGRLRLLRRGKQHLGSVRIGGLRALDNVLLRVLRGDLLHYPRVDGLLRFLGHLFARSRRALWHRKAWMSSQRLPEAACVQMA